MFSKINTATIKGITAVPVTVETDLTRGLPNLNIVGLADTTVKEAKERIHSAIINSNVDFPCKRITINMAPASIRKRGSHFDLPMAMGILVSSSSVYDEEIENYGFIGELSLDGRINKTDGVLPMVACFKEAGIKKVIVPYDNKDEAALIPDIIIYPAKTLEQVISHFNLNEDILSYSLNEKIFNIKNDSDLDFADVKGQSYAKRAITIAVAGGHGILMTGSPSTGKTMISERIPTIMPRMTYDEVVETTMIYSARGLLDEKAPIVNKRPFRRPHHKITTAGLLGGGSFPRPGEITLANNGVLFLDEVGEYDRYLLDTLRVPLEEKKISLTRMGETYVYPANFMLVAATNPCKCGYYGDPTRECKCSKSQVEQYQSKLSGPVLDRIDINIKLYAIDYSEFLEEKGDSSIDMRRKIEDARKIQFYRFKNDRISLNNQMNSYHIEKYCTVDKESELLLEKAYRTLKLNPRTLLKIKKVARTIADLENEKDIKYEHIAEAVQYRDNQRII